MLVNSWFIIDSMDFLVINQWFSRGESVVNGSLMVSCEAMVDQCSFMGRLMVNQVVDGE